MADTRQIDVNRGKDVDPTPPNDRPEYLPEGMETPEDLAKAYQELRAQVSKRGFGKAGEEAAPGEAEESPEGQPDVDGAAPPDAEGETPGELAIKPKQEAENLLAPFLSEFSEKGKLSEESFKKLEGLGVPRMQAEAIVNGLAASEERALSAIVSAAGGKDQMNQMLQWASRGLSEPEQHWYNEQVNSGNGLKAKAAVEWLGARYRKSGSAMPQPGLEGITAPQAGDRYESMAQVVADMAGEKYKTDPAERARVQAKLARTDKSALERRN